MKIVNVRNIPELHWGSPSETFEGFGKQISEALGREPDSTDLAKRHPFDVELSRFEAGTKPYPYHSHSAQWEFYYIISGSGFVRHEGGTEPIGTGDTFLFRPGEAHQLYPGESEELVLLTVADNPIGESTHYPDDGDWVVRSPQKKRVRE